MNTALAKRDLFKNLKDREYREAFNLENVYATLCAQIQTLREQRHLSQAEFGRKAKMAQERISILEDPNAETKPTLSTLLRIAAAFDVGLEVRFVPFSKVLTQATSVTSNQLEVASFDQESEALEKKLEPETARATNNELVFQSET